jgi:hypothetical protein
MAHDAENWLALDCQAEVAGVVALRVSANASQNSISKATRNPVAQHRSFVHAKRTPTPSEITPIIHEAASCDNFVWDGDSVALTFKSHRCWATRLSIRLVNRVNTVNKTTAIAHKTPAISTEEDRGFESQYCQPKVTTLTLRPSKKVVTVILTVL